MMTEPALIPLRLSHLAQLHHTLDPSPFREGDLDAQAEAYIVESAQELPRNAPIRIELHLPAAELTTPAAAQSAEGIARYFEGRARAETLALRALFRDGRAALALGLAVLAACLSAAVLVGGGEGSLGRILQESLVIVGWVALWRPAEIFLYDWLPIVRRRGLFRRLAAADVRMVPRGA
jgi:hypothetical protein